MSTRPRTLAELVTALGIPEDEAHRAAEAGTLGMLVISRFIFPGEGRYTQAEMAELTGMGDDARRYWHALGFPDPPPDERAFTDADLDVLKIVGQMIELRLVESDVALQMARVIGASMARVAAAQLEAIEGRLDDDLSDPEHTGAEPAVLRAGLLQTTVPQILEYAWRRHMQASATNRIMREGDFEGAGIVVGFADLVGFTALAQQVDEHELAAVVERFERTAYDIVGGHGGRVVKMIGDEVMFAVPDPLAGLETALALAETFHRDDALSDVRVGLALGPVLAREGDLYGPTVNLASRIVALAFAGSVVTGSNLREALADVEGFRWKSLRTRQLRGIGRVQMWAVRRASEGDEGEFERSRRRRGALRDRVAELVDGVISVVPTAGGAEPVTAEPHTADPEPGDPIEQGS